MFKYNVQDSNEHCLLKKTGVDVCFIDDVIVLMFAETEGEEGGGA